MTKGGQKGCAVWGAVASLGLLLFFGLFGTDGSLGNVSHYGHFLLDGTDVFLVFDQT